MKHLYTANDIAQFFIYSDFTISDERKIINELWHEKNKWILYQYRKDKQKFIRTIYSEISKYDGTYEKVDEINIILQEMKSSYHINGSVDEIDVIDKYFKFIKLKLTFIEGTEFCKIKLRNLIGNFGYKRRSQPLVDYINKTIHSLKLETYLKGMEACDISYVKLDEVVIIRLDE